MTYSSDCTLGAKTIKDFHSKVKSVQNFVAKNIEGMVQGCLDMVAIRVANTELNEKGEEKLNLQAYYENLVECGFGSTVEKSVGKKGKVRYARVAKFKNENSAIDKIAENSEAVLAFDFTDKKVESFRGIVNAVFPKTKNAPTNEGEGESEGDEIIEGQDEGATKRTFAELLKNFQDIVQAQGDDWNDFLDYAIDTEGAKVAEGETAMSA